MSAIRILAATAAFVAITTMAAAGPADIPAGASACSGCHAAKPSAATQVPRLNGRDPAQIIAAMAEFRSGARSATVMDRIAKGFTDDEVKAIAAWYAAQKD